MVDEGTVTLEFPGLSSVDISFDKIEHDFDKQLIILAVAQKGQTPGVTLTYIIDIVRLLETITVTGYLLRTATKNELAVKNDLIEILKRNPIQSSESDVRGNSTMILSWGTSGGTLTGDAPTLQKVRGDVIKCKITEVPGPIDPNDPNLGATNIQKRYEINLQFSVGTMR